MARGREGGRESKCLYFDTGVCLFIIVVHVCVNGTMNLVSGRKMYNLDI